MDTNLTVAQIRRLIGDNYDPADFINLLNRATEELINAGLWEGNRQVVRYDNSQGFISLPYEWTSILGAQWFKCPVPLFTMMHPYMEGGPGDWWNETQPFQKGGIFQEVGDGFAIQRDIPTAQSTIRIALDLLIDSGKTFRLYGISNGRQIEDVNGFGMNITVNYPFTDEGVVFDVGPGVTGIQVPQTTDGFSDMVGSWTMYSKAPDGTLTVIGRYYASQIFPQFKRYTTGTSDQQIRCLCRRRWIPVRRETDWVWPPLISAINKGMKAVQCQDASNNEEEEQLIAGATKRLNQLSHAERGGAKPEMPPFNFGFGMGFTDSN